MSTQSNYLDSIISRCLLVGDFTLRSGAKSNIFLDMSRLASLPALLCNVMKEAVPLLPPQIRYSALAGIAVGGIPLALALGLASNNSKEVFTIRLDGKKKGIEGGSIDFGESLILVEDVMTTGGAVCEAIEVCNNNGVRVEKVICVVNRSDHDLHYVPKTHTPLDCMFHLPEKKLIMHAKRLGKIK